MSDKYSDQKQDQKQDQNENLNSDVEKNNWLKPQNLKSSFTKISQMPLDKVDPNSDFGSYKIVNQANALTENSNIKSHVFTDLKGLTRFYKYIFNHSLLNQVNYTEIIDIGCGLGFATQACFQATQKKCYGVEISTDATEYAQKNFPQCTFISGAVDPDDANCPLKLTLEKSNQTIVIASEFYPFTRTHDSEYHKNMINHVFAMERTKALVLVNSTRYLKEASDHKTYLASISSWQDWGYNVQNIYTLTPNLTSRLPEFSVRILNKIIQKIIPIGRGTMHIAILTKK